MLKKTLIILAPLVLCASWQNTLGTIVDSTTQTTPKESTQQAGMSQDYASKGLKETLGLGVNQAVSLLGKEGGFLNNKSVKIPLPSSMQTVANVAEKVGGKAYVDDLVQTMNTAASKAVPKTASILSDTISRMSMEDAKSIINGKDTAATTYFQEKSGKQLLTAIMPIIKESSKDSKVMSSYQSLNSFTKSNQTSSSNNQLLGQASSIAKSVGADSYLPSNDEDIEEYIARKTLDGLFYMIGEKEKALRSNPLSSGSKTIQDIFSK